jgi:alkaline phosphatase D
MLKRRNFLRATAVFAGALVATGCGLQRAEGLEDGSAFFPQSVASGDPRPHSVVLWTRVEDHEKGSGDVLLSVEVSTTEDFSELAAEADVRAPARHDHCVKVKVVGLDPATTYYYRFLYTRAERRYASRTGRTRTAPAEGADTPVRFAFVSCQSHADGFFNSHLLLAQEDVDFVVFLGDYIYETTAAGVTPERAVTLADAAGAIALGEDRLAAASLDNYRELYRRYRADPALQRLHERFAMITIWDDHEFSNDSHGASGSYTNGREDEVDEARRKAANRAWFEYQPVDYGDKEFTYDPAAAFPGDIHIYRDLVFGRHVHLVMTDLRTYRSDHVVPEEGLPGAVVVDQTALLASGPIPTWARPYLDIETYEEGLYRDVLREAADRVGYDATLVQGLMGVDFVNEVVRLFNEAQPDEAVPEIDITAQAVLPRGISLRDLGKRGVHSAYGSRHLVVKDAFDMHAQQLYHQTNGRSERVMGPDQEAWFLRTMEHSQATWKVWGSAYALSQLAIDLTDAPLPADLRRRYYLSADAWDGFRNRRDALLAELAPIGGVVAISGDAHAFFAGTPSVEGNPSQRIVEIVGAAMSAPPLGAELASEAARDPELSQFPGVAEIAAQVEELLTSPAKKTNPHLGLARTRHNGYVVVEADANALTATLRLIDPADLQVDYAGREEELLLRTQALRVRTLASGADLYLEENGGWRRWDAAQAAWV